VPTEIAPGVIVREAAGDPNVGAIIGSDGIVAIDALATPTAARPWLEELRELSDKPIRLLVLTHYHAVRVLGASAFDPAEIVASRETARMIEEQGMDDWETEFRRFPRLAPEPELVPGLTIPSIVFDQRLSIDLGDRELIVAHAGRGHTGGDTVAWLPQEKVLFSGDLVEDRAALYMGEAYAEEWATETLDAVASYGAETLVPGRGGAVRGGDVERAIGDTRRFIEDIRRQVAATEGAELGEAVRVIRGELAPAYGEWTIFEHCLPFNVKRIRDELAGLAPRVWTAAGDGELKRELGD
jgi:glyoxylase-like metal-dependent hydrolase (beta-lactamase superfamily II)